MHELLPGLPERARVLDLGCGNGSFERSATQAVVFGMDLERGSSPPTRFVCRDAALVPFASATFDVIVSNHSLEHIGDFHGCLLEISRTLKPTGSLYVAVPDSTTLTDRLYRWLARGGGHVNPFPSATDLSQTIERTARLPHRATRTLCTSFSFLNRKLAGNRPSLRLLLFGGGTETSLLVGTYILRLIDRFCGTRLIVYGWAFYFGAPIGYVDTETWTNVCIRCGSGHASSWLLHENRVFRRFLWLLYRCPQCETLNLFTRDEHYAHLRPKKYT